VYQRDPWVEQFLTA